MNDLIWSWLLTIVGATCFYLAGGLNGRKVWWAWYVGIAGQVLWLAYSLVTAQWGFLAGVIAYTVVYTKNAHAWTRDHLSTTEKEES